MTICFPWGFTPLLDASRSLLSLVPCHLLLPRCIALRAHSAIQVVLPVSLSPLTPMTPALPQLDDVFGGPCEWIVY
ncbi:hypothetical protein EDB19DRAFT_1796618 [Suillus lakei]|nr:hypothetical protein EDB19DRAFT_1796618 [Suillus lakei]